MRQLPVPFAFNSQGTIVSRRAIIRGLGAFVLLPTGVAFGRTRNREGGAGPNFELNGSWRFALAPTPSDAEALSDFFRLGFPAERFTQVPVPSNWAVLGFEEPQYRDFKNRVASEGFFLRPFNAPATWDGRRILLHFNGVWSSAEIWLNGNPIGRHDSGFTSFAYDISEELTPGQPNLLAVRVRQVHRDYQFDTNDDWALGGIFGDVWMETMPGERWIDTVCVETRFDDLFEDADLNVRVMVADTHTSMVPGNYMSPGQPPYDLLLTLRTHNGEELEQRRITVPAHFATGREIRTTLRLTRPTQWNAEQPYLYTLVTELLEGGKTTHRRDLKVGIRQVSTEGGVFRINGQAVKLRGVNRHEEHPDVGRATNREHWLEDITLMKAANINYVRCAHYPPAPGFLALCDELGMYVGDEIPMNGAEMNNPASAEGAMLRVWEAVSRDINHPCVIYWSIGNEDPMTSLHLAAVHATKGLDPTRPVLFPWRADDWLPPEIDILAPHYWQPAEYDALAGRATRPIITTEYTHAFGSQGLGSLRERWEAITRHPSGAGGAIWMWADQGLKTRDGSAAGISRQAGLRLTEEGWDGITDAYRRPTLDYWETKAVYAQVYPSVESVPFTPGEASVQIPIRNDYDFTDLGAVRIEWQIMEDDRRLAVGGASLEGQAHSSTLLDLPLASIGRTRAGSTYYAWLTFRDRASREITKRTVELIQREPAKPLPERTGVPALRQGGTATIGVRDTVFQFDTRTGLLTGASIAGRPFAADLRPSLWRQPDDNERYIGGRRLRASPDLNMATAQARHWQAREVNGEVVIDAVVDHVVDARNRYTGTYTYTVSSDGRLAVRYAFEPQVEVPWLLHVGMMLRLPTSPGRLRWLGLGPYDAYPNKQSAAILGLWSGAAGGAEVVGMKRSRWAELTNMSGHGFRAANDAYIYSDTIAPDILHLLSSVLGRPEKSRQPIEPVPQLTTEPGKRFVGELVLSPVGRG